MTLLTRVVAPLKRTALKTSCARSFSSQGIPDIQDFAVGRQRAELDDEKRGLEHFNSKAVETEESEGNSPEDPILVPGFHDTRIVGVSHNDSSYFFWFTMTKGKIYHLPQINKYFLLYNPAELAEKIKEVEAKNQQA